jgi:hypothetical protein
MNLYLFVTPMALYICVVSLEESSIEIGTILSGVD